MKNIIALAIYLLVFPVINAQEKQERNYVPDAETAIKIAEAIWLPIYGERVLDSKPYTTKLINDTVWRVEGFLPPNMLGGVPLIEIQKKDCKILKVTHGK